VIHGIYPCIIVLLLTKCMNFNTFFLRSFRVLLFPLALVFGLVLRIRNYLYDRNVLKSTGFNIPIINVGNLSVGGTGKSPMVDYLVALLKREYRAATLSRGYKRRTKGYLLASDNSTAVEIGDEPMQFHLRHPEVAVAVGEERLEAVPQLLYDRPSTELIILDDAFQHRAIKPGLNILLSDYNNLYTRDFYLPTGDLRDNVSSASRADLIIITKCKNDLSEEEAKNLLVEIGPLPQQQLFFSAITYGLLYHLVSLSPRTFSKNSEVLLVCGIANPEPLTNYLNEQTSSYDAMYFKDHHIFSIDDLREIRNRFEKMQASDKLIVTTEKDAVRLIKFKQELKDLPFFVLPISVGFLFNGRDKFNDLIINFIRDFKNRTDNNNE
jgi:tetraacyldisaccharide 4'-kinase